MITTVTTTIAINVTWIVTVEVMWLRMRLASGEDHDEGLLLNLWDDVKERILSWNNILSSFLWSLSESGVFMRTGGNRSHEPQIVQLLYRSSTILMVLLIDFLRRYLWCNGYRRRKWTRWHEFKSWTRLIAFHIVLIPLGKVWIQLFSIQLLVSSRADWFLQPWWGN